MISYIIYQIIKGETMEDKSKQNVPLVTHIYTADPSAHVFEDKIYIYPSNDL